MSFTTTLFPIIAALLAPEGKFLPKDTKWRSINTAQEYFLKNIYTNEAKKQLSLFSQNEMRYFSSNDYKVLNKFAKDNGFNIQLEPFSSKYEFGSVSILDVILKWKEKGKKTVLEINAGPCSCFQTKYNAAKLKNNFEIIKTKYEHPIVKIYSQGNDTVYLTIADKAINKYEEMIDKINTLKSFLNKEVEPLYYDNLIFPCVNLNQEVNIGWLLHLEETTGWFIDQAKQQTKFKMDEEGARVESCVLLAFSKGIRSMINDYKIDKPFYIWIERKGATLPIFSGYITQEDWVKAE